MITKQITPVSYNQDTDTISRLSGRYVQEIVAVVASVTGWSNATHLVQLGSLSAWHHGLAILTDAEVASLPTASAYNNDLAEIVEMAFGGAA